MPEGIEISSNDVPSTHIENRSIQATPSARLDYLEGLRGVAALYVVFHHIYLELIQRTGSGTVPNLYAKLFKIFDYGHYSVDIFIVLSGYCLMIPVAKSKDGELRGGFFGYIKRRALRILVPYYPTLILTLLIARILWNLEPHLAQRDYTLHQTITVPYLLAQSALIQNLFTQFTIYVNGPLWSVATEWQIYFIFPILLIIYRKAGILASFLAATLIWFILFLTLKHQIDLAYPWFIILFAMGMAGATINFSHDARMRRISEWEHWKTLTISLWLGTAVLGIGLGHWFSSHRVVSDSLTGIATLALLITLTGSLQSGKPIAKLSLLGLLTSKPVEKLGSFSYSLYLVHYPILVMCHAFLIYSGCAPLARAVLMYLIGLPSALLVGYLFSLAFEKPIIAMQRSRK